MKHTIKILSILALLLISVETAYTQEKFNSFGTVKEIKPKAQTIIIEEYDWEKNEPVIINYRYNIRNVQIFNMKNIADIKPDDQVEYEWVLYARRTRYITKISIGSMPIDDGDLNMDWLEEDPAEDAATTE